MLYRLVRGGYADFMSLAKEKWTLCPEEFHDSPKAVYLDGAVDKIKTLSPWRHWQQEQMLIRGGPVKNNPTTGHLFEGVRIIDAYMYSGAAVSNPGYGPQRVIMSDDRHQILEKATLVTTWSGSRYFGCLLLDDFPLELIEQDNRENIGMVCKAYGHEAGYRRILGLEQTPIVKNVYVRKLTIYIDSTNNSHKAARYKALRRTLRHNLVCDSESSNPGVYLKRGATGEQRILENEQEVEAMLTKIGFDVVEPAILTVDEIARKTMNAKIVVSIEGSHLSHVLYTMADGGAFIVIQPPDRFAMVYKEFTDCLGMKYAFLVGDESNKGFKIELDDLKRIIDRLS